MTPADAQAWLLARFAGLVPISAWGEVALFHNPGATLPRGAYFATIKTGDGAHDRASRLGDGRWRFNFGMDAAAFSARFGPRPPRPAKAGVIEGAWDFAGTGVLTPHPVYGWMGWAAIVNPDATALEALAPELRASHARAVAIWEKRMRGQRTDRAPQVFSRVRLRASS